MPEMNGYEVCEQLKSGARVETHVKLRRAREAERDLLERTLSGAFWPLLELVQITSPEAELSVMEQSTQGAYMLHLALELDQRIYRDIDFRSALAQLKGMGQFNGRMLDALDNYFPTRAEFEVRQVLQEQIRVRIPRLAGIGQLSKFGYGLSGTEACTTFQRGANASPEPLRETG